MKPNQSRLLEVLHAAVPAVMLMLSGLLLGPATRALGAEWSSSELDPVVGEIIEMLNAGVDEGVILQWLESTDRRPADIGSQGLIALTAAEASEEFVKVLLASAEPPPAAPRAVETTPPVKRSEDQGTVEAVIRLRAKRVWVDEDEPDRPREPPWNVFLYLDGEFVSWTRATLQGEPVEARRMIEPGPREMRVVLQRYEDLRGGWLYESLSVPTLIGFEARGGNPVEIEVEMKRIWGLWRQRKDGGPLSYVIRQGDEILAEHDGTAGDPNRWQPVCEDVEANFPESETVPKRFRNPMSRCILWADLWTGPGRATSRQEILRSLAEDDFRPVVR